MLEHINWPFLALIGAVAIGFAVWEEIVHHGGYQLTLVTIFHALITMTALWLFTFPPTLFWDRLFMAIILVRMTSYIIYPGRCVLRELETRLGKKHFMVDTSTWLSIIDLVGLLLLLAFHM